MNSTSEFDSPTPKELSKEELVALIEFLKEFQLEEGSIAQYVKQYPSMFAELADSPFSPGWFYEFSHLDHVTFFVMAAGLTDQLKEVALSENRIEKLRESTDAEPPDWLTSDSNEGRRAMFKVLLYTLIKNANSIRLIGRPINDLVELVATGNELKEQILFDAIKLDRTVIGAPTIAAQIALADLKQDKKFKSRLANAVRRPLPRKRMVPYGMLRYVLSLLQETGQLHSMSEEERYQLLCVELELYPSDGGDPARSLSQFIRRWKKYPAT